FATSDRRSSGNAGSRGLLVVLSAALFVERFAFTLSLIVGGARVSVELVRLFATESASVNVKARTSEKLNAAGEGKSVEAHAVVVNRLLLASYNLCRNAVNTSVDSFGSLEVLRF
ncbi:hypothetical protein FOZ62_030018, partial [Perkinsus olseni]